MKKLLLITALAFAGFAAFAQQPSIADVEAAKRARLVDIMAAKSGGGGTNEVTDFAPEQDCVGAITVCQSLYLQNNSYTGAGSINGEINNSNSCLGAGELNSVWYKIMVANDGYLGFNITPNSLTDDYDWAVFNLTNSSCANIFNDPALEISCNFSGSMFPTAVTGPNGGTNPQDSPLIDVYAGEIYYINVSNFSSTQSGYTLDFSPSTIALGNCSFIYGSVYFDNNVNCQLNPGDDPLPHQVVYALPGPYYALSDSNGLYRIGIPQSQTGNYQLFTQPLNPSLVQECPVSPSFLNVNVTNTDSLYPGNNFGFIGNPAYLGPCPVLQVSNMSWGLFLNCCGGSRTVQITNTGTASATNVQLELQYLDNYTMPTDFWMQGIDPLPFTQNNNSYFFNLPDIPVGHSIAVQVSEVVVDTSFVGLESCVMAHVTPDAPCVEPDSNWDQSNIELNTQCVNDTVVFTLHNTGTGSMAAPLVYTVYEGQNLLTNGTFQLAAGQSQAYAYPSSGNFYVMQAQQSPYNPVSIQPSAFIQSCGDSTFVPDIGFNNFTQGDQPDAYDMDCNVILNSYDPNDKQAVPIGLGPQHFITNADVIEYKIRFQNIGTGPAQKVVVIDTLDSHLERLSLQIGASNYPCSAELVGNGVLFSLLTTLIYPLPRKTL